MLGIDMDKPITFFYSSLRFFADNEYHVTRLCNDDVLLLVYDGVLRFEEDGIDYEVHPGEYHIQKCGSVQRGTKVSDSPKYLYVHFHGEWGSGESVLPRRGTFDYAKLRASMEKLDELSHGLATLIQKSALFYELLLMLMQKEENLGLAHRIADYIDNADCHDICLDMICDHFHFSKNHIINIFRGEFGMTPVKYINRQKLAKAKYLLEVTSDTTESIAQSCGFFDASHLRRALNKK